MAETAYPYEPNGIFTVEEGAIVFRWCLKRKSDGRFTVVHTEFRDPFDGCEKVLADIVTPVEALNLTWADEPDWQFFPTVQEAVAASKLSMNAYSDWMKNARNY